MKLGRAFGRVAVVCMLVFGMTLVPVCAAGEGAAAAAVQPRFNNISAATLTLGLDDDHVAYCGISIAPYPHGSGMSGLMRIYEGSDTSGNALAIWPVSDYEEPFAAEFTYQCKVGKTYTVEFTGYAYSNNGTAADRLELTVTDKCKR